MVAVREVMVTDVKTIGKDSTVKDAAGLMSKFSIGSLIVLSNDRVVGIITERDILKKVVAEARDSAETRVKDVMATEVVMVEPDLDIQEAANLMAEKNIKKLPVIDRNSLVGIITVTDLCRYSPKMMERLGALFVSHRDKGAVAG